MVRKQLVENVEMVRTASFAYKVPQLRYMADGPFYQEWHWRCIGGIQKVLSKMTGETSEPDLQSFRPEVLSMSRHKEFVWLEYFLAQAKLMFCTGRTTDCDFTGSDPKIAVLVPRGWARGVINCVRSGIVAFDKNGRAVTASGEVGPVVHHPAIARFRYEF